MQLGAFSVSLSVKDLAASIAFYKTLGFEDPGGCDPAQGWVILRSGTTTIGLFQDMFEGNILTFNPGWDSDAQEINPFEDVREIQARLKTGGLHLEQEVSGDAGPGHLIVKDPDGNVIMVDQHR